MESLWRDTCARAGLPGAVATFPELAAAYMQSERHYHGLSHIAECLSLWGEVRDLARNPVEVELAIWFHDVVYDTHAGDNEAQSAAFAERVLRGAGATAERVGTVRDLVLATCHAAHPTTEDQALLLDIDLAILGAPPAAFDRYEAAVRAEYAWVSETLFWAKRSAILSGFLARPVLFHTPRLRDRLEVSARENLARSIAGAGVLSQTLGKLF